MFDILSPAVCSILGEAAPRATDAADCTWQTTKNEESRTHEDDIHDYIIIVREFKPTDIILLFVLCFVCFLRIFLLIIYGVLDILVLLFLLLEIGIDHIFSHHLISIAALAGMVTLAYIEDHILTGVISLISRIIPVFAIPELASHDVAILTVLVRGSYIEWMRK